MVSGWICGLRTSAAVAALTLTLALDTSAQAQAKPAAQQTCDVRQVDWKNFKFDRTHALQDGERSISENEAVSLDEVRYGDVDRDGVLEAYVFLRNSLAFDDPDNPRGMDISHGTVIWVVSMGPRCTPRVHGRTPRFFHNSQLVDGFFLVEGVPYGLTKGKYGPLPRTHPTATRLRIAQLASDANTTREHLYKEMGKAKAALGQLDTPLRCLIGAAERRPKRAQEVRASNTRYTQLHNAARTALTRAQKKPNDRSLWLRASEALLTASLQGQATEAIERPLSDEVTTLWMCQRDLSQPDTVLTEALASAQRSIAALTKLVAGLRADKVPNHPAWAQALTGDRRLVTDLQKRATSLRQARTKAERSLAKDMQAAKPDSAGATPHSPTLQKVLQQLQELRTLRASVQAGLEQSRDPQAEPLLSAAVPGCSVRSVDWSNFHYAMPSFEGTLTAGEQPWRAATPAKPAPAAQTDKPAPAARADKKKKPKKGTAQAQAPKAPPAPSVEHMVSLSEVRYLDLDGVKGDEAYVRVEHDTRGAGAAFSGERVWVFDVDADCKLRARGEASVPVRGVVRLDGITTQGKRLVWIDAKGERREWSFAGERFEQVAGLGTPSALADDLTGLYDGKFGTLCMVKRGDRYEVGVMADMNSHSCLARGTLTQQGDKLRFSLGDEGEPPCVFEASVAGRSVRFPEILPDSCTDFCGNAASLDGLEVAFKRPDPSYQGYEGPLCSP